MFREESKKQLNEIKEENKCLGDAQENTNMRLIDIMTTTWNLKNGFNKEIEILKRTQVELKIEVRNNDPTRKFRGKS